jgi:putative ABC transport system permease protein
MAPGQWLYGVPLFFRGLFRRRDVERDLDDEFSFHLEQLVAERVAQGQAPDAARVTAQRDMARVLHSKDACRDAWHVALLDRSRRDVGYAVRRLIKTPGATALALVTLALTIGANTAIFSVVNAVLMRPSSFCDVDRIVWMAEETPRGAPAGVSSSNYLDWKARSTVFESLAAWDFATITLSDGIEPIQVRSISASPAYFDVFHLTPILGRTFSADESDAGKNKVAILSRELWTSRFGADPTVIGRVVHLREEPYVVVGVMDADASAIHWGWSQVWTPLSLPQDSLNRSYHRFNTYAKLRSGVSLSEARAEMARVAATLSQDYPDTNRGWHVTLEPYASTLIGDALKRSLSVLLATVGALLLIGCVNLANMALTQGLAREREIAIRCAVGGGRRRLIGQLLTESVVLSLAGGFLGILVGVVGVAMLKAALPAFSAPGAAMPPASLLTIDYRVLGFTTIVSVLCGILFGLAPAYAATRIDLSAVMRDGGRGSAGTARGRLRQLFIVTEIALAFVLLTTAGLFIHGVSSLWRIDLGVAPRQVMTATIPLSQALALEEPAQRGQYLHELLDSITSVPGVTQAALTSVLPMQGVGSDLPFQVAGRPSTDAATSPTTFFKMVTADYFSALGLTIRSGRAFTARDRASTPLVAIINDTMARQYFADAAPIGQHLLIPQVVATGSARLGPMQSWEIVGVVANERVKSLAESADTPGVYVPLDQSPTRRPALVVRASDASSIERTVVRAVASVNGNQALADVNTLEAMKDAFIAPDRQRTFLATLFASLAALLAGVGIYGVTAAAVSQRTHEFGIRAALGATAGSLALSVFRQSLLLAGCGLAIGTMLSLALGRLLSSFVVGLTGTHIVIFAISAGILGGVALVGSAVPGVRAARVSPLDALRQ